jgi:glycine oxidase
VNPDCCIVGGGIIGLSIARELAGRGHSVRVLTRESRRATASWAAVGIFPPAPPAAAGDANAGLTALSHRLHRDWSRELLEETGIDNGLLACGGLHVVAQESQLEPLQRVADSWRARGARCEWLSGPGIAEVEPALAPAVDAGRIAGGFFLPEEMQFRSPRQLEALERACRGRGVVIDVEVSVDRIDVADGRIRGLAVQTPRGPEAVVADQYVIAAGAWTGGLVSSLGITIDTRPIRGQIVLVRFPRQTLSRIVNRGLDYLVPREEGLVLVGSTLEDVGFEATTAPAALRRLLAVAADLLGDLTEVTVEMSWAGLRPGSVDGLPSIGRVSGFDNAVVAAGHFRAGLHQSTGTAVIVADLVEGHQPPIDIVPFAPGRVPHPSGSGTMHDFLARAAAEEESHAAIGESR